VARIWLKHEPVPLISCPDTRAEWLQHEIMLGSLDRVCDSYFFAVTAPVMSTLHNFSLVLLCILPFAFTLLLILLLLPLIHYAHFSFML